MIFLRGLYMIKKQDKHHATAIHLRNTEKPSQAGFFRYHRGDRQEKNKVKGYFIDSKYISRYLLRDNEEMFATAKKRYFSGQKEDSEL